MAEEDNLSAVLYGPGDLRLEQREIPKMADNQLLISVHTVGIGTSDVEFLKRGTAGSIQLTEPIILGHETSGTVDAVGEKVTGFKAGDRVALEPGIPCHKCSQCMIGKYNVCPDVTFFASPPYHGSLTRFVVHDANFCYKLPDNVSYEDGALLEPLSVAVHACRRAQLKNGTERANSRSRGMMPVEIRDAVVKSLGHEPEVTIECTGAQPCLESAILATRPGGVLVMVGLGAPRIELPIVEAALREIDIRGVFRYASCYPIALDLVASGRINLSGLTRANYDLGHTLEAFERAEKGDVIKVFIKCQK
ncbi:GroES-like protein [Oesophagostomum dentatum]|uniref:Sorbitol dehydrogenase n=1 Tax=Oesophagostomum dentatum TaxID=61180 RepID=A0A0B1T8P0_OESDE|nr:GroES-like protein [Oesophagostomum dentatum]